MQIIISPTKQMRSENVTLKKTTQPQFKKQAQLIRKKLAQYSLAELQELWKCSQKIAKQNFERLHNTKLISGPAILMYQGLQFQNMDIKAMTPSQLDYLQTNLLILSGMYGLLRPFDEIEPYRLEMQAKLATQASNTIYEYWGASLYTKLFSKNNIVINLASKEYAKAIKKYIGLDDNLIDIVFLIKRNGKFMQQATIAKQARGRMINYCAINELKDVNVLKNFNELGFKYDIDKSSSKEFVFVQSDLDKKS